MPLKRAYRLPGRFNRRITRETRALIWKRRRASAGRRRADRFRVLSRTTSRVIASWKRSALRLGLAAVAGMALLVFGLLLFSPVGRIEEIRVVRTDPRLDIERVIGVLQPLFGRHLVVLPSHEADELLRAEIPDIASVRIAKRYPSQLIVHVELQKLVARLVIAESAAAESASGAILDYLTEQGTYIVSPVPSEDKNLPVLTIVDWGIRPVPGTKILSAEFFQKVRSTEAALQEQFGRKILKRILFLRSQEFHVKTDQGVLWFDARSSLDDHLKRYRTFLKAVGPEGAKEYVDLRLADRVVYR